MYPLDLLYQEDNEVIVEFSRKFDVFFNDFVCQMRLEFPVLFYVLDLSGIFFIKSNEAIMNQNLYSLNHNENYYDILWYDFTYFLYC